MRLALRRMAKISIIAILMLVMAACAPAQPEPYEGYISLEEPQGDEARPTDMEEDAAPVYEQLEAEDLQETFSGAGLAGTPNVQFDPGTGAPPNSDHAQGTVFIMDEIAHWLNDNLSAQIHGGYDLGWNVRDDTYDLLIWVVDESAVNAAMAGFQFGAVSVTLEPTRFSLANAEQLEQQIRALDGAEANIMNMDIIPAINEFWIGMSTSADPAFVDTLNTVISSSGFADHVWVDRSGGNVNF